MNDTPLIGLVHNGSHAWYCAQQKERNTCPEYAEVLNIRKSCAFRLPSRHSTDGVHTQTFMHGVGEDQPYAVPRRWVACGSPGGSAEAV